jgi:hypothetical protein
LPSWVNHLIIYSEYPEFRTIDRYAMEDQPKIFSLSQWDEVLNMLQEWHPVNAKVAVFVDGTIQISG